jgi:hypothetical protein
MMRSDSMTAARVLYSIARFALFLAVFVIAGSLVVRVFGSRSPEHESVTVDSPVDVPTDWATYPIAARARDEKFNRVDYQDGFLVGIATLQGRLGDVFVRYDETSCTAGGSACTGSPRTLTNLRVGDLDANGAPAIAAAFDCTTTNAHDYPSDTRTCASTSLKLRRSPDGKISVVTFTDPEPTEKPVAAFTRSVVWRSQAPLDRGSKWLCFVALALFASGAFAMITSRRYFGERGILTWKDAGLAGNIVTCGEFSAPLLGLVNHAAPALLIDPEAIANAQSYRDAPSLNGSAIFFGTRSAAVTRAQMTALAAAILFFASAGVAALCAALALR